MSGALPEAHDDTDASGPVAPDRPTFDLRARVVETVVLVASVVVLRMLGVLLLVVSSYGLGSIDVLLPLVRIVADPNLLVWIALAAAVQFGLRSMRRPGRWALIVLAAPVAVLMTTRRAQLPQPRGRRLRRGTGQRHRLDRRRDPHRRRRARHRVRRGVPRPGTAQVREDRGRAARPWRTAHTRARLAGLRNVLHALRLAGRWSHPRTRTGTSSRPRSRSSPTSAPSCSPRSAVGPGSSSPPASSDASV